MKKINIKIAEKLGEKFKETSVPVVQEPEEIKPKKKYIPMLNYNEFELDKQTKEKIINFEEKVIYHASELSKNTIELAKVFYQAQQALSLARIGTFTKWYEGLGFKKDYVYMLLKRNELYMKVDNEKVFHIPEKAIKAIEKIKNKVEVKEILEIVNSNKPVEIAKEKENSLSGNPKDEKIEIEKIKNQIYIKEQELKELKKILKEKIRKYENRGNI